MAIWAPSQYYTFQKSGPQSQGTSQSPPVWSSRTPTMTTCSPPWDWTIIHNPLVQVRAPQGQWRAAPTATLPKSLAARRKPPHVLAPHREASHPAQNKTPYHPTPNPAVQHSIRSVHVVCVCACMWMRDCVAFAVAKWQQTRGCALQDCNSKCKNGLLRY